MFNGYTNFTWWQQFRLTIGILIHSIVIIFCDSMNGDINKLSVSLHLLFLYQQSKGTILINITRTELYTSSSYTYLLMRQKSKYSFAEIIKWVKVEGLEQPFFDTNTFRELKNEID